MPLSNNVFIVTCSILVYNKNIIGRIVTLYFPIEISTFCTKISINDFYVIFAGELEHNAYISNFHLHIHVYTCKITGYKINSAFFSFFKNDLF
jgi:hypothetical protein